MSTSMQARESAAPSPAPALPPARGREDALAKIVAKFKKSNREIDKAALEKEPDRT